MPNRRTLFNALKQEGYDNFKDENDFNSYIESADNRKILFNALKQEGYDNFEDEAEFDEYLGYSNKTDGAKGTLYAMSKEASGGALPTLEEQAKPNSQLKFGKPGFIQDEATALHPMSDTSVAERLSNPRILDENNNIRAVQEAEEEANIDKIFVSKPMNTPKDVYDNYSARFTNTQRGIELGEELASITKGIQDKYLKEYLGTGSYKALTEKYQGEELAKQANEQFARMYGELIEAELEPYQKAYNDELNLRYGSQMEGELNRISKNETGVRLGELSSSVDSELNNIEEKIEARTKAVRNVNWRPGMPSSRDDNTLKELRGQRTYLNGAKELIEESQKIIQAAKDAKDGTAVGGVLRGVRDKAFDIDTWTMGLSDLVGGMRLNNILEKVEKGEKLTSAEEMLFDASVNNMAINYYYQNDLGKGYMAGQVTGESLPFMLEMIVNPISASGNVIAKRLLNAGLKKFAKNKAAQVGARLVGDATAAIGMSSTTGMPSIIGDTYRRMNENYNYGVDAEGNLYANKKADAMGMGEAFARSFTTRAIENQSEMIFNAFKGMGGFMKGVQDVLPGGVNKFFDMISHNKVADAYRWLKNSPVFRNYLVKDVRNATQIGGIFEEYAEEVYNNLANFAIGEMSWEDVVSLDKNIDTFLGLAPTQVMFGILGLGGAASMRYQTRKTLEDLQATMNEQQRKELEGLLDMGIDAREVDVRGFIRGVMENQNYTIENKRDLIKAAYYVAQQRSIDELTEADVIDKVYAENQFIDSMTDPSTGNYAELSRTVVNPKTGESEQQKGYVVGWIGEGEKRQPIFVADGMENNYANRVVLKPTEWSMDSYREMPAEQVKAVNEEMNREEAAQQAERESKYAPEVLNAQMEQDVPFETEDAIYVPISPMLEGNGWVVEVQPKGVNNKAAARPFTEELTNDQFHDILQAQINAQDAAEPVNVPSGENVGEEVNAEVNAPVNNENVQPVAEGVATEPQSKESEQPTLEEVVATLPKTKNNEIDYKAMTPQQQYQYTSLTESPGVALEDLQADIAAGQEEIAKKQEKLSKARGGERAALRDEVRKLTQAQAELQAFYDSVAPKQEEVANEESVEPVTNTSEEAIDEPKAAEVKSEQPKAKKPKKKKSLFGQKKKDSEFTEEEMQPMNAIEFAASHLASGNIAITTESFKRETGYGEAERKKFMGMLRTPEKGGMTIEQAAEKLVSLDNEQNGHFFEGDTQAARDTIIELLGYETWGDVANLIKNNRTAERKKREEAEYAEYEAYLMEALHVTPEELELQKEYDEQNNPFPDVSEEEYFAKFAEKAEEYINYLNSYSNEQGRTDEVAGRNDSLLSEERTGDIGGNQRSESERESKEAGSESIHDSETSQESISGSEVAPSIEETNVSRMADIEAEILDIEGRKLEIEDELNELGDSDLLAKAALIDELSRLDEQQAELQAEYSGLYNINEKSRAIIEEEGGTPLFRQKGKRAKTDKKPFVERAKHWEEKTGVKIRIADSLRDVKNRSAFVQILRGSQVTGWFEESTGEVVLYMPHIASIEEVDTTFIHEVVAHKGLRGLLGERFNEFLDEVWNMMSRADQAKYLNYPGVNGDKRAAADEYIANTFETIDVTESAWSKLTELIKRFLKAIGLEPKMTNADIANVVKKSYQRLTAGEGAASVVGDGTRFRFIGEQGAANLDKAEEATTRLDNLSVAREMEAAKKDAKAIKMATGWERGADGLWRYETSDANVKEIKVRLEDGYFGIPLTEVVDDKELFKAYPELENAMFTVNQRTNVPYAAGTRITMPARYIVQEGYDEAALEQVIKEEKELAQTPEFIEFKEFYKRKPSAEDMKAYEESHPVVGKYKDISQRKASLARKYGLTEGVLTPNIYGSDFIHELQHVIQYLEGFTSGANTSEGYDRYHRNAGEVEARNAATRINMTPEERRSTLASETEDVAREDQIFLNNALGEGTRFRVTPEHKQHQMDIINETNPAPESNYTWIRSVDDIKSFEEALDDSDYADYKGEDFDPSYTWAMAEKALRDGKVIVYSSYPIKNGVFVTPSYMEAQSYGGTTPYMAKVNLEDVAWIDPTQGQLATDSKVKSKKAASGVRFRMTNAEKEALRDSEESKALFDYAKKRFGRTFDLREAGYVLPDGSMLDFSGRHEMAPGSDTSFLRGTRSVDHRGIVDVAYDFEGEETGFKTDMADFLNRGAIRIDGSNGAIDLTMKPTSKQKDILRRLVQRMDGDVWIDFSEGWDSEHYVEYAGVKPMRVISDIDKYYDEGIKPEGNTRFRISNKNQEIFVSNAQRAVEGIKQEKATPQQWLAMIEKNGGLKAGEDKWLGLSDWLKGLDKKSVTKDEILDFIGENKIRIEEVHYGEDATDIDELFDEYEELYENEGAEAAHNEMISRYGEEFDSAFMDIGGELRIKSQKSVDKLLGKSLNSTRLEYTTEGLENKREIALIVPTIEPWNQDDKIHFGDAGKGRAIAWIRFGETRGEVTEIESVDKFLADMRSKYNAAEGEETDYMNEDEVKQLQTLTSNEIEARETAPRILVIDEIQSKRHQEGREKGYKSEEIRKNYTYKEVDTIYGKQMVLSLNGSTSFYPVGTTIEEAIRDFEEDPMAAMAIDNRVPNAPFEKNWSELAFKRMLRYAAENGFDKVAWTTGAQQAERYNIGGVVSSINYFLRGDGSYRVETYGSNGYQIESIPTEFKDGQALADVYGKELATKMVKDLEEDRVKEEEAKKSKKEIRAKMRELDDESAEYESLLEEFGKYDSIQDTINAGHEISGDGLRVGGEGMKGFYDKMLPSFVNKYVKKWGTKVQDIELPNVEEAGRIMHSVDVTEAMKESVMEGQTMFRVVKDPAVDYISQSENVVDVPRGEVMYTMNNIANQLYKVSGRFMRELYKYGTIGRVLKGEYAEIDQIKAKKECDHAKPIFEEYLNELVWMKYQATEAAQEVINDVISDVEYAMQYYKDLALGKDVWRTKDIPRFRISEKHRKDVRKAIADFTSSYNSKPVSYITNDMTDEQVDDLLEGYLDSEDVQRMKNEGAHGFYLRKIDRIYIFVDDIPLEAVENSMFHENLHLLLGANNPLTSVLWDKAKSESTKFNDALKKIYKPHELAEEYFVYKMAKGLTDGEVETFISDFAETDKEALFNILNTLGYEYESESRERLGRRRRIGGIGDALRQGGKSGERRSGESREALARKAGERKERLQQLFGRVAEMGLDGVLGNKEYVNTMVGMYKVLPEAVQREVADEALSRYGGDVAPAVSDWLNHKADASVWDKVVAVIREALRKVGFDLDLNTNEAKYILWRSQKPLNRNNLLEVAEDIDMKYRLKVGEYSTNDDGTTPDGGGTKFRVSKEKLEDSSRIYKDFNALHNKGTRFRVSGKLNVRDEYEATIKKGGFQAREAVQDAMLSLRKFQELIEKVSGKKIRDFENAWMHENRLSSVVQAQIHEMERKFYKPMMDAVKKLMAAANLEQEQVADYLMLKHGIERNREMAVRKALTDSEGKIDRTRLEQWYQDKRNVRSRTATPHLDTWRKQQEELDNIALMYGADMSRDYSGLTSMFGTDDLADSTQQAYDEVEALETAHSAETEALGKAIKAMTQNTLDESFGSGLMDRKVYDELSKDMYDYYIPLRGFDETTSEEVYAYLDQDRGAFNAPLKRAKGRSSKSDNPIAYLKSIAESGIMQGERNKMKQSFLNLVINNPSDLVSVREGVWAIYNPASGEWEAAAPPAIPNNATPADVEAAMEAWEANMESLAASDPNVKKISEAQDIPYRVVGNRMNQHQVIVKRLGKSYTLTINGNPRLAMALNGLTNPNNKSNDGKVAAYVSSKIDSLNRTLSAWYTTRNPDFVASNFMRDTFYTNTIVRAKEGNAYANKFHKNYGKVLPQMLILFSKYERGTLNPANKTEAAFLDFMMNGGETGYSNLKDLEEIKKQIAKELKGNRFAKVEELAEKLDILNRAVENTARFAAYLTSREVGRSVAKSIYDAKEISVNFNKKGAGGTFFGMTGQTRFGNLAAMVGAGGRALYVFFNAAVQGTTNLMHVMKVNPKGTSAGLAAMFLMGAVVPFLFGGDDDDEKDYYDLPEHVRRNHLIIPGAGDAWISFPLPIEYRIMYGMGELLSSWRTGHERGSDIARKMLSMTGQALPLNFLEEGLEAFVPSAVSPIYQVMTNSSWTGLPIYKENDDNKSDPEYTKAYSNVDRNLLKFTKALYEWTFDEENQEDGIDLNPAIIETLAKGYFGGLATQLSNLAKVGGMIAGEQEFDWRNIPIGNRILKTGDERTKEKRVTNEYFKNMEQLDFLQSRERMLKKAEKGVAVPEADKFKAQKDLETMRGTEIYKKYQEFKKQKKVVDKIQRKINEKGLTPELEKQRMEAREAANKAVR